MTEASLREREALEHDHIYLREVTFKITATQQDLLTVSVYGFYNKYFSELLEFVRVVYNRNK